MCIVGSSRTNIPEADKKTGPEEAIYRYFHIPNTL